MQHVPLKIGKSSTDYTALSLHNGLCENPKSYIDVTMPDYSCSPDQGEIYFGFFGQTNRDLKSRLTGIIISVFVAFIRSVMVRRP
jgi:hypothetical protein